MIVKTINIIRKVQNRLYSIFLRLAFKKAGYGFSIEYPVRIIGSEFIAIGENFKSFGRLRLEAYCEHNKNRFNPKIVIGDNVSINTDCHIGCINSIRIGNGVLIASRVFITDHFHGEIDVESLSLPPSDRLLVSRGPVVIERNVWIGEGVAIMPNVTLGENCIVGANSVVTKSFEANSVIAGIPARVIKKI